MLNISKATLIHHSWPPSWRVPVCLRALHLSSFLSM